MILKQLQKLYEINGECIILTTTSTDIKLGSEIFYNFAVGVGAISGGIFAIVKIIGNFISNRKINSYKDGIKKAYPREKLGKLFKLIDTEKAPGRIYLIDLNGRKKHWIESAATMTDLDFFWDDVERISQEEFDRYKLGSGILTSGTPGS